MSHLKLSLIAVILFTCLGLSAQNINNQFLVYAATPNADVVLDVGAASLGSTVVEYTGPGQHLALLEWDGVPFIYELIYPINNMVDLMSIFEPGGPTKPIDIDGGTLNKIHNPFKGPGVIGANRDCYPDNPYQIQEGDVTKVGIFDTGLNYDLAIENGYDFKYVTEIGNDGVTDVHGHGTHIGTIIDGVYHKYMPNDPLHYVIGSSFDASGQSTLFNLLASIEDALHLGGIDIMNFSFSYPGSANEEGDAMYLLLSSAIADDILFVCAAGNDNQDLDNSGNNPGSPNENNTYFPAAFSLPTILTVGSYVCDNKGAKVKSWFSNYGTISADFAAPGEDIEAMNQKGEMEAMTGTSQATAMVTAAATVLKSKFEDLNAEELKCLLINYGEAANNLAVQFKYGRILSIDNFINQTDKDCPDNLGDGNGGGAGSFDVTVESTENLILSPNPFTDVLNIQYNASIDSDVTFQVYAINGQLVSSIQKQAFKGNNDFNINFNNIAFNNQYVLRIISNDQIETRKISRF